MSFFKESTTGSNTNQTTQSSATNITNTTETNVSQNVTTSTTEPTTTSTIRLSSTTTGQLRTFLNYSEDYPKGEEQPCYLLQDIVNASVEILSKRCQQTIYGRVWYNNWTNCLKKSSYSWCINYYTTPINCNDYFSGHICPWETSNIHQRFPVSFVQIRMSTTIAKQMQ